MVVFMNRGFLKYNCNTLNPFSGDPPKRYPQIFGNTHVSGLGSVDCTGEGLAKRSWCLDLYKLGGFGVHRAKVYIHPKP